MPMFFHDINTLHRFTLELERHQDTLQCRKCMKRGQFVSHGYLYKKQPGQQVRVVGKRIFCANRCRRSGCGATRRLYLAAILPVLRYTTCQLAGFLTSLSAGASIEQAYHCATGTAHSRQAYRWLRKLEHKLVEHRCCLDPRAQPSSDPVASRRRRLQLLLSTFRRLVLKAGVGNPCEHYQQDRQQAFV